MKRQCPLTDSLRVGSTRRVFLKTTAQLAALGFVGCSGAGAAADDWVSLFDGQSLEGWRASENKESWHVEGGCLVASGPRSHLFYEGPIGNHNFRNFELTLEVLTKPGANSGVFIHTRYQETGSPSAGYEVQINNSYPMIGENPEFRRTGGLFPSRMCSSPSCRTTSGSACGFWWSASGFAFGSTIFLWWIMLNRSFPRG